MAHSRVSDDEYLDAIENLAEAKRRTEQLRHAMRLAIKVEEQAYRDLDYLNSIIAEETREVLSHGVYDIRRAN